LVDVEAGTATTQLGRVVGARNVALLRRSNNRASGNGVARPTLTAIFETAILE
jgi:hypothetical protein